MADQLLSQADVDALVASLTKNEAPKAVPPLAAKPAPVQPARASVSVPRSAPASNPMLVARPAAPPQPIRAASSNSVPNPASHPSPARVQAKPEADNDLINSLNTRVAELTKQLNSMGAALKRMEMLERKVTELEAKAAQPQESQGTAHKVQLLTEEMKKIVTNLKGTPGYGVRHSFTCEKCDDHGHVAVQFRCTSCGNERWYGWWPSKK
jgi:hypothetical protein